MEADRWKTVQRLFHEALDVSKEDREAFLADNCGDDAELRAEVDSLLEAHFDDDEFLEKSAVETMPIGEAAPAADPAGERIGDYEIVERIGVGGMGDVLLAKQQTAEFSRNVAIKIVKRGMDTEQVLRRFALERQILATLQHPNIAQLYDAGATGDGRPYFVMEYVDGERIDDWIKTKKLSTTERLKLFHAVCQAVQYAHQNLVLHRDIKPGNVLLSKEGVPKLVDFGIGKLLSDEETDSKITRTRHAVMTPDYAAPEQLRGEAVTTATDIYALGALLFEILTGERPWGDEPISDAERARRLTEQLPTRPSLTAARSTKLDASQRNRLAKELRGELDDIVLQAMRAEPDRRYRTAAALAEDVDRYLKGLPVEARGDSRLYLASKFVRRNAWMVAAAAIFVGGLIAVTATTIVQSERVARERDKAQEVQRFLLESFGASTADGTSADAVSVRAVLDGQAAVIDQAYGDDPELKAEMLFVLGDAYDRLGLFDDAAALAERSLSERQLLYSGDHPDVASSLNLLGWTRHRQGESNAGAELLEESVAMWRALDSEDTSSFARALNDLGVVYDQLERSEEAETLFHESLEVRTRDGSPTGPGIAVTSNNLSVLYYRRGDYDRASEFGELALESLRETVGPDHERTFVAQSNLSTFRWVAGDLDGAAELLEDLLEKQTRLEGGRNARTANSMYTYASLLRVQNRMSEAEQLLRDALEIQEEVLDPDHRAIGNTARLLGIVLQRLERNAEAIPFLERALDVNRRAYGEEHRQVAEALAALSASYVALDQYEVAEPLSRNAASVFASTAGPDHPWTIEENVRLGRVLLELGETPEATTVLEAAHGRAVNRAESNPILLQTSRLWLAEARFAAGDWAAADALVTEIRAGLSEDQAWRYRSRFEDLSHRLAVYGSE